jgi:ectoine hydroxylase-related dioxygenase (phytanoyl-CoA dioxygenase family)
VHQEKGTQRLSDLVNKGSIYDGIWMHPRLLAATHYILKRDYKLLSLNARDALPGQGHQDLHADWSEARVPGAPFHLVNALICIDDFAADNGATRIVPGSHLLPGLLRDHVSDTRAAHPREIQVICPAGTVAVINGQLWHGGTVNRSGRRRRVLHCACVGREHPQFQMSQREYVRKATWDRLTPAARYILDVL